MLTKKELYQYTGDVSQLFYARPYRLCGGRAEGMLAADVNNGAGLCFTVLADRAMDIARLSYRGVNFAFATKAGLASPAYYDGSGDGWLKTFGGGFLTTCGLTQAGSPCESDGEALGLHGSISAVPAEDLVCETDMDAETPEIRLRGKMRSGQLFGRSLWMTREYRMRAGENKIYISDTVENRTGNPCPYMILYHFNLGYPLLDEDAMFITSASFVRSRDDIAKAGEDRRALFQRPELNFREQVYYYKSAVAENGQSYGGLYNDKLRMGVRIWSDPAQLPHLVQWKNPGAGDYVMGIEPSNCYPEGREKQKEYGLDIIEPYGRRVQELCIEIV